MYKIYFGIMKYIWWIVLVVGVSKCQVTTQCSARCGNSGCDDKTGDCYACQTGRYGPKCDKDCGACVKENCSSRACTLGCKAGYFQVFSEPELSYCQSCIPNCAICSNSTYCAMCNEEFYLMTYINQNGRGEAQCIPCSASIPFCTSCYIQQNVIVCNLCTSGYALSQNLCAVNYCTSTVCLNGCDSSGVCYGCVDGFIGPMCNYHCNSACAKCSTQNICEKCRDGFYSQTCIQSCNLNCLSINNQTCNFIDGKCSYGCNNGFWGDWCENKCSVNCKEFAGGLAVCFRNGTCALGCKEGLEGDTCTQKTSITTTTFSSSKIVTQCNIVGCEECNSGAEHCYICLDGFWLEGGNCSRCPDNCLRCTDNTYCHSCLPKYHGIGVAKCQNQCSATCDDSGCDEVTGDCNACQTGHYGPNCYNNCGFCVRENCSTRACIQGCKAGYFQAFKEPELSYCQPCIPNCISCTNSTHCSMCNEGFYLTTYINQIEYRRGETQCIPCSTSIPFCTSCYNQQNVIVCNRCTTGYALSQNMCAVNNCTTTRCLNGCDSSGICYGCVDGLTGPKCSYLCNSACAKCSTQDICEKCRDGFYSQTCIQSCNLNCLSINNQTCNFIDGKCSYGCNNGFWGDWCENKCSVNCKEIAGGLSVCFQNGTCALGCKDGMESDPCTQKTFITTTLSSSSSSSSLIEIDECESSPCENGATCTDKKNGFSCIYAPEYKEIDECESSPCENEATCTDKINGYSCMYAPEYKEDDMHNAVIGGLSAAVGLLFVALVVLIIHKLRSRSDGVSIKGFCCTCQKTKEQTNTYATLQIPQPSESNEYDVMELTMSVQAGTEPETVQSQNHVEYINTTVTLEHRVQ